MSAPEFGNRSTATMTDKPQLVSITVSAGWVEGEASWTGEATAGYDPVQTLSGYSAKFKLPLEELPEMPKE